MNCIVIVPETRTFKSIAQLIKPDSFLPVLFLSTTCLTSREFFSSIFFCSRLASSCLHSREQFESDKKSGNRTRPLKNQVEECSRRFKIFREQRCLKRRRGPPAEARPPTIKCWALFPCLTSNGLPRWERKNWTSTRRTNPTCWRPNYAAHLVWTVRASISK